MTTQPDKPKRWRWRPRFSLRTLVVLITLVCVYAACWGPTKKRGAFEVYERVYPGGSVDGYFWSNASPTVPLVVGMDNLEGMQERHYYFWFFGYVCKLPYEREVELLPAPQRVHRGVN